MIKAFLPCEHEDICFLLFLYQVVVEQALFLQNISNADIYKHKY